MCCQASFWHARGVLPRSPAGMHAAFSMTSDYAPPKSVGDCWGTVNPQPSNSAMLRTDLPARTQCKALTSWLRA
eukprot:363889-Chlamydomonas_euryale.AAC.6